MIILIDYDNLDRLERQRGVRHVITNLLAALDSQTMTWGGRVNCRLYGGWFDGDAPSRSAERLLPEVQREFPCILPVRGAGVAQSVSVHVDLARSLACDPGVVLTHTYRRRSFPRNLRCESTPYTGCVAPSHCPVAGLDPFLRNGICPVDDCNAEPQTVLTLAEQKLVDSMLVVDLTHFADTTNQPLVVVSADEDLWPGIRFVLLRGARVIHVLPWRSRVNARRYRNLKTETYSQIVM